MNHEMLPVSRTNLSLVLAGTGGHLSTLRGYRGYRGDPAHEITRRADRLPRNVNYARDANFSSVEEDLARAPGMIAGDDRQGCSANGQPRSPEEEDGREGEGDIESGVARAERGGGEVQRVKMVSREATG